MSVREDAAEGSEIMRLVASDGDGSSPNNDVFYRITSGAKDKFVVDSDTGKVCYLRLKDKALLSSNPKITSVQKQNLLFVPKSWVAF
jgi:hypothetical protein